MRLTRETQVPTEAVAGSSLAALDAASATCGEPEGAGPRGVVCPPVGVCVGVGVWACVWVWVWVVVSVGVGVWVVVSVGVGVSAGVWNPVCVDVWGCGGLGRSMGD